VTKRRLQDQKREMDSILNTERVNFKKVISALKKKLENTMESRDVYKVASRVHKLNTN
jgi:hypothetical protein